MSPLIRPWVHSATADAHAGGVTTRVSSVPSTFLTDGAATAMPPTLSTASRVAQRKARSAQGCPSNPTLSTESPQEHGLDSFPPEVSAPVWSSSRLEYLGNPHRSGSPIVGRVSIELSTRLDSASGAVGLAPAIDSVGTACGTLSSLGRSAAGRQRLDCDSRYDSCGLRVERGSPEGSENFNCMQPPYVWFCRGTCGLTHTFPSAVQ
jgi:hypothetical protein